ncbi:MAG: NADH-quinone oxidoreductase subunit N [Candidatus Omnitrophica bacterium]|nr:NADH-quinone oxidoreductase subunit N [Candidatus Omnitrophota bacterium]
MSALPWSPMAVELWLAAVIAILIWYDLTAAADDKPKIAILAIAGLLPVFPLAFAHPERSGAFCSGMYLLDPLARGFKAFFALTAILVIAMTREFARHITRGIGELYLLILTATFGMMMLASAGDFLMLFIALEIITLSFYVMTTYLRTDEKSVEAGMKYLILGALSTGFLLYGISFLYGYTGSTNFAALREAIARSPTLPPWPLLGFLLIVAGIGFKVAAVPFHWWAPDVYEGAPTPVTAFLSVGSKAAGFVVLLRLLHGVFEPASGVWMGLLVWIAGVTILYGNLVAMAQMNMKRLLAYSSIGHAGYLLIGIAAASGLGAAAVTYYLGGYLFTNLAAFLVVIAVFNATGSDDLTAYAGLSKRAPVLAAAMFVALLSLAGVPPLAGFVGKFLLLMAAVHRGLLWLAAIGAAAVVISLYYYLLIVKRMFVDPPADPTPIPVSRPVRWGLYGCMAGILAMGIWQQPFLALAVASVRSLFS